MQGDGGLPCPSTPSRTPRQHLDHRGMDWHEPSPRGSRGLAGSLQLINRCYTLLKTLNFIKTKHLIII